MRRSGWVIAVIGMNKALLRQLFRYAIILSGLLTLFSPVAAQFSRSKLDSIRSQLKLLGSTRADVVSLLSPGSFSSWNRSDGMQTFYREDETVDVFYSTGKCEADDFEFMPWDAWSVPTDTLVSFEIEPKDKLSASDLGFDLGKLKKERPYRTHKNYLVYFDKDLGLAIHVWGDTVYTIRYFPSRTLDSKLCDSVAIKKYFRGNKWRFTPEPKHQAVDFNRPASVLDINLTLVEPGKVSVNVTAEDPENDVLTYNYKVSAGRILGVGAKVLWDLSGLPPGTYTMTCAVDDGIGLRGRYITRSIKID